MPTKERRQRELARRRQGQPHVEEGFTVLITRKDGTKFFSRAGMSPKRREARNHKDQMLGDIDGRRMKVVKIRVTEVR